MVYAVSPNIAKVLGRGEGLSWPGDLLARLPEEVGPGAVFPLWALDANLMCRHPGPRMHRCVARTKVVEILLLTYPHVLE